MLENVDLISLLLLTSGGPIAVFGFFQVAKHGLPVLPWFVLLVGGVWAVSYGWTHLEEQLPVSESGEIVEQIEEFDLANKIKEFNLMDTLEEWCSNLD